MYGVVSLLDPPATKKVRATWAKLERDYGTRGVLIMPYPHFSYQIAHGYDRSAIQGTLARLAGEIAPFEVTTSGIATFPGAWPVVFVAVDRTASLAALHARVFDACVPASRDPVDYYRPGAWIPHITLAHGEERNSEPLPEDTVRSIVGSLDHRQYCWRIRIDNLALVWDEGTIQRPVATFRFTGT